jgi:hypothetical protein
MRLRPRLCRQGLTSNRTDQARQGRYRPWVTHSLEGEKEVLGMTARLGACRATGATMRTDSMPRQEINNRGIAPPVRESYQSC